MCEPRAFAAIGLGATSGRVLLSRFDGERLSLEEDYEALSRRMQAAFEKKFFQADKAIYDNGSQTSSLPTRTTAPP